MAKRETVTIPTVEEAQLLLEQIEGEEKALQVLDALVGRLTLQLKEAKNLQAEKLAELRGTVRARSEDHPLFDQAAGAGDPAEEADTPGQCHEPITQAETDRLCGPEKGGE
jgi:hypothetical protein